MSGQFIRQAGLGGCVGILKGVSEMFVYDLYFGFVAVLSLCLAIIWQKDHTLNVFLKCVFYLLFLWSCVFLAHDIWAQIVASTPHYSFP